MTDLNTLTIAEARDRMRAGDLTSRQITEACVAAVEAAGALNATCHDVAAQALEMADAADKRRAAGENADLLGIPIAVKDLFCTNGVNSQAASNILGGFKPAYESTVTTQLWDQGAVMACKTSMDEFAMGSSTETSCYGPAISPWRRGNDDAPITPGGSSGGSSAAVAADLALAALGTDTGGSIRQPAALTGTVGIKPTYGRVSRWGIVAFASSLDQ
ncbi:MAG: amidase, partial [Pseudomonadota bacterium]